MFKKIYYEGYCTVELVLANIIQKIYEAGHLCFAKWADIREVEALAIVKYYLIGNVIYQTQVKMMQIFQIMISDIQGQKKNQWIHFKIIRQPKTDYLSLRSLIYWQCTVRRFDDLGEQNNFVEV